MTETAPGPLLRTPLHQLHVELGARMVPFAGYDMPVQYPSGILVEHQHTRAACGLFDVGHMGQIRLTAKPGVDLGAALETIVPGDIATLEPGQQRYTQFTDPAGGILDDLMVTAAGDHLLLVVNAGNKQAGLAHLRATLADRAEIEPMFSRGLLALQGPLAAEALGRFAPQARTMKFMAGAVLTLDGVACHVTRSGYTGGDGYEISMPGGECERIARALLAQPEVKPIGLGARDSLRLEAGLCLHGHDIDTTTTPIEAGLLWSIPKRRRATGGFPGDGTIVRQIAAGPPRRRVGLLPEGRQIAREGAAIALPTGEEIGRVTSGGFSPTLGRGVAMGYVARAHAAPGTRVALMVRGKPVEATVAAMPFVPHAYWRG